MRMRRKKWAQPFLYAHPEYALTDPKNNAGLWKQLLGCKRLHVEIGTGKGDYLNTMSAMYPEEGWVGIEKEHNAAAVGCRKALEDTVHDTGNRRMIIGYAEDMLEWFAPHEIDVIHLNFSDPWPKKYAHKRRLSSEKFLEMYRILLNENGSLRMKTDNKSLFEDSVLYFLEDGWQLTEFSVDYRRTPHPEDAITEYENRFMSLNQPIYQLAAVCRTVKKEM
ncbi:MAG: tRNA (guanosine(46)-N7)-methyltransferase TrmB [Erysipelotrichia bacterium]|nr:tRNA (guanosine(46)-N7)-methyltransferase TrmB [Erysipelotrichia bacterium]